MNATAISNEELENMSVHDYRLPGMHGEEIDLSVYRGKTLLIVNTASRCGYARHFAGLQQLQQTYRDRGLELLGVPCNQFNGKEPGTDPEIAAYCAGTFDISFPLATKLDVRGETAHPLFAYLTEQAPFQGYDLETEGGRWMDQFLTTTLPGIYEGDGIKWNFTKFLVDANGQVVGRFETPVEPEALGPYIERVVI